MFVKSGNDRRKIVEFQDDDPRLAVLPVTNDRQFFRSGIVLGLIKRLVEPEPLGAFALEVDILNVRDNVGRIGRTLKLHSSPGRDAQNTGQFACQFPLAAFAFRS